ncbi:MULTISPECIES: hypothetical protein [unclassified Paenibacillus]|uniref:hypothetical protein n=1 Tax=unclassified Paenibacillus TaxID=185978 RepID=UPI000956F3F1|nr:MULTISPECIES: hypothetical protein [unclassified Paenibacillus]ASS64934.2 hypothetical protein CIC07_01505 [Paenibacillus sp. RUD330]SIR00924.1 hypothetical protein SAMN05880555_2753 [Paenibacillus sp. RU4X]SIR34034.1 hypothetical protein SAMN05880570_3246 [Paenibacillus sp. RU4T]
MRRKYAGTASTAIAVLLCVLFLANAAAHAAAPAASAPGLAEQAEAWRAALSAQPEFSGWKGARAVIEPLGPGTHSWLVTLDKAGRTAGYMIINARQPDGYSLGEYGAGSYPLYSSALLQRKLKEQNVAAAQLTRLYASPAAAVWRVVSQDREVVYADAWTGELLPISDEDWAKQLNTLSSSDANASGNEKKTTLALSPSSAAPPSKMAVAYARTLRSSDPMQRLSWLVSKPIGSPTPGSLASILKSGRPLDYASELYAAKVLQVWQAAGLHRWTTGQAYASFVNTESAAKRYITLEQALLTGQFYRV